jgi:hypothetical protein
MSACCSEYGCRRKKPVKLTRSPLTGTWYVVTAYTDKGDGIYRASTKHALEPQMQEQLEAMREALQAMRYALRNQDADA